VFCGLSKDRDPCCLVIRRWAPLAWVYRSGDCFSRIVSAPDSPTFSQFSDGLFPPSNDLALRGYRDLAPIPALPASAKRFSSSERRSGSCNPLLGCDWLRTKQQVRFAGNINLYRHDCLSPFLTAQALLLDVRPSSFGSRWETICEPTGFIWHSSSSAPCLFYPKPYRFSWKHLFCLDPVLALGRRAKVRNSARLHFCSS